MRVCETSDMQVSRLSNETRSRPWDELLNSRLGEALSLGIAVLSNELEALPTVPIDDYRSNNLVQLNLVEVMSPPRAGRRSSPIVACAFSIKSARRQSDVAIFTSISAATHSGRRCRKSVPKGGQVVGTTSSSYSIACSRQSSGRRTGGGVPRGKKVPETR